jgi:hypothetical protein
MITLAGGNHVSSLKDSAWFDLKHRRNKIMEWEVILLDEFALWLGTLEVEVRTAILGHIILLRERGPNLGRPYVDTLEGSQFSNMKELRIQVNGNPWRVLFAFDPNRAAILLVGGNKTGDNRWYKKNIPIADSRFARHLAGLGT